jgi:hypothetical protein
MVVQIKIEKFTVQTRTRIRSGYDPVVFFGLEGVVRSEMKR